MTWDGSNLTASLGANLPPGTYPVSIRAEDAAGNWSQVSTTSLVVKPAAPIVTATVLTAVPNPSAFGQPVTITATVTPAAGGGVPAGAVSFYLGHARRHP
jgi:hypothetical protein